MYRLLVRQIQYNFLLALREKQQNKTHYLEKGKKSIRHTNCWKSGKNTYKTLKVTLLPKNFLYGLCERATEKSILKC